MTKQQNIIKRSFDLVMAVIGLMMFLLLILICWFIASIDTRQNGFFTQERIGKDGRKFLIIKIRTMRSIKGINTVFTMRGDPRVTRLGSVLRKFKLDELPQLINILLGDMSFVGPRPDVVGFADLLQGDDRVILKVRPGITGPATLVFRNEENILSGSDDPESYNRNVIFPAKVKLNKEYLNDYSFLKDILYIIVTIFPGLQKKMFPELIAINDTNDYSLNAPL